MFTPIDSFDDVVARYENTTPLVTINITGECKPLGARRRGYERIIKIDEDTYALLDGNLISYSALDVAGACREGAPILWVRKPEGVFVYIRGCPAGSSWPSRWAFLATYLPTAMRFVSGQSKPYQQQVYTGGKAYGLVGLKLLSGSSRSTPEHDTDMSLVFKALPDGTFERVGQLEVVTDRVDIELKKQMKPELDAFYEYMLTMAPFIVADEKNSAHKSMDRLCAKGFIDSGWGPFIGRVDAVKIRPLLTAPDEDENKLDLMITTASNLYYSAVKDKESLKYFRQRYNNWCIKTFKLYKREYV